MSLATLGRLLRLAWSQDEAQPDPGPSTLSPDPAPPVPMDSRGELGPDALGAYLAWQLGVDGVAEAPRHLRPAALLQAADREISAKGSCTRLLRRSPAVLPRLIRILRNETYTTAELAQQIQQDIVLTAEVLRMARSAQYLRSGDGAGLNVREAVAVLGSTGVEQVIARVVVRPLYRSDASSLQSRAAGRLWEESERCALACVLLARGEGVDAFDAYVAGLLQNAGWGALLRTFEIHRVEPALSAQVLADPAHQRALVQRRDQLLARLLPAWDLSAGLSVLASGLGCGVPGAELPLAKVLRTAHEQVAHRRLAELAWQATDPLEAAVHMQFMPTQPHAF